MPSLSILHDLHASLLIESPDGLRTSVSGTAGYLTSPNHPGFYPSDVTHTWEITTAPNSTIKFTVLNLETEPGKDILQVGWRSVLSPQCQKAWTLTLLIVAHSKLLCIGLSSSIIYIVSCEL